MVNRPCEELFPRAAVSQQQHRRIRRRNLLDLLADLADRSMLAHDARETVPRGILFPQDQVLAQQLLLARAFGAWKRAGEWRLPNSPWRERHCLARLSPPRKLRDPFRFQSKVSEARRPVSRRSRNP